MPTSSPPPPTMRAYTHTSSGHPSTILTPTTLPTPKLTSPTHLLIRTSHCALNPGASIIMQLLPFIFRASPAIPEMDFSGTIVELGPDVPAERQLGAGTRVFGSIPVGQHVKYGLGALAEYIVVEHDAVVKVPESFGMKEVAGLGIAGATALVLMEAAQLNEGERVLVVGAGGGIGHLVLQMCHEKVGENGRVMAITSSRHESWLRQLVKRPNEQTERLQIIKRNEVDVVKYLKDNFAEEQFDLVLDASGIQRLYHSSSSFLKSTSTYASVGPRASSYTYLSMLGTIGSMASNFLWPRVLGGTPRRYVQVTGLSSLESLEQLAKVVGEGKLKLHVGGLFEWEEVLTAYQHLLGGHAGGKVVISVQNEEQL